MVNYVYVILCLNNTSKTRVLEYVLHWMPLIHGIHSFINATIAIT